MIGANDVTHRVRPPVAVRHLDHAVSRLHELGAEVVVGTCPDLGTVEPVPQPLRWIARRASRQLAAAQTIAVVEAGGRTVSLGDILGPEFAASPSEMFGPDRFHPSVAGYASAAAAMLPSACAALGVWIGGRGGAGAGPGPRRGRPADLAGRGRGGRRARHRGGRRPGRRPGPRPARPLGAAPPPAGRRHRRDAGHRRGGRAAEVAWRCYQPVISAARPLEVPVPEAVIVATARSPIGRAMKGSLVDVRPDHLAATIVRAVAGQGPRPGPQDARRPDARLRRAGGEAGRQHGPPGRRGTGLRHPARHHGQPVLRVVGADLADGLPRHQGGRGARLRLGRRRVRVAVPGLQRGRRRARGVPRPRLRRGAGPDRGHRRGRTRPGATRARTACCPTCTSRWARPPRTWRRRAGISRAEQDEFGVRSQNLAEKAIADGFFDREITPVTTPVGHRGVPRRRPPSRASPSRASPGCGRSSARRARSPPATAARSTTAPRPS